MIRQPLHMFMRQIGGTMLMNDWGTKSTVLMHKLCGLLIDVHCGSGDWRRASVHSTRKLQDGLVSVAPPSSRALAPSAAPAAT